MKACESSDRETREEGCSEKTWRSIGMESRSTAFVIGRDSRAGHWTEAIRERTKADEANLMVP